MMRQLYALAMTLVQPLLRRKLLRRGRVEPGYLEAIGERFGHYQIGPAGSSVEQVDGQAGPQRPQPGPGTCGAGHGTWVWVHAVSLGETRAATVLVAALRQEVPGMRLLLTHGTATGRAEGRALLREGDVQVWQPWDAPGPVARFLTRFQPRVGILMETEVWPTLTAACQARGVPLLLVNARLSDKSLRNALRLAWLARPAYGALAAVYAQTPADAQRLRQLDANVQGVFGNLKFDAQPDPALLARGQQWRAAWAAHQPGGPKPVVLFASSREGEEALLLKELAALPVAQRSAVQWLIVPRHPQRFDEVAALAQAHGWSVSRRSAWEVQGPGPLVDEPAGGAGPLWLGDSLGEMPAYYALSDLALLGGSFLPLGGQNLIEAAACGCPVVMGPHTFNFAEAAQNSADAGAAFKVENLSESLKMVAELLQKPQRLAAARQAASAFVAQHRGAAARTLAAILPLVSTS